MKTEGKEEKLLEAIGKAVEDGRLPCAEALQISDTLNLPRRQIGDACNRLKIKINRCQLGCFE